MSGRVVVGYTATNAGLDAVALGARLAVASGAQLDVVLILPGNGRNVIDPSDAGYDRYLLDTAEKWLSDAAATINPAITSNTHIRFGESFAEGLMAAAKDLKATHIVIGTAGGGRLGRHRLGTVATTLLHSAEIPVVLAPEGSRNTDDSVGITRITAAVGTRPGAGALMNEALALVSATGARLRLLSLVTVDLPPSVDTGVIRITGAAHADDVLASARAALPSAIAAEAVVARGTSIEDAVQHLEWEPGEIAMVGSSRLARRRRLFLGSTAAKMLHELTVPMIVVPRNSLAKESQ
ncbi:universal stress protein [Salinibacterium sp. UTAS2018]|uniref:universal stress protein n=1 Tax=Salinibacterium sp. UTAS2018 TaxID=2508880 RepID=UPI001009430D|nr:universal stress protein [Salinibacterium sp. UTAS2018]QAV71363.1 universal stress protein [Salinibacterium sp. UTAS2018]